jgi:hypothetical protein
VNAFSSMVRTVCSFYQGKKLDLHNFSSSCLRSGLLNSFVCLLFEKEYLGDFCMGSLTGDLICKRLLFMGY